MKMFDCIVHLRDRVSSETTFAFVKHALHSKYASTVFGRRRASTDIIA